jgi:hypothetical protein
LPRELLCLFACGSGQFQFPQRRGLSGTLPTTLQQNLMNEILDFIKEYWLYIVAICSAIAVFYDKFLAFVNERKKKKQAYNRVFSAIIKIYYSYLKYKLLYSEIKINVPDKFFLEIIKNIDNFKSDLDLFKISVFAEAEIIPEVTFKVNHLFEILERLTIFDKMKLNTSFEFNDDQELLIKRAQVYSVEETFDNFFLEIMNEVKAHTKVSKKFMKQLQYINTDEFRNENKSEQMKVFDRYIQYIKTHSDDEDLKFEIDNIFPD